jgi:cytochrome d ubiquinol oxidase subunit I
MVDIWKVLTNSTTLAAYPHVIAGALMTAATFVGGISAWSLLRDATARPTWTPGLRTGAPGSDRASPSSPVSAWPSRGDFQARLMFEQQPMKMASAEALCEHRAPGPGLSVFALVGESGRRLQRSHLGDPQGLLSLLATAHDRRHDQGRQRPQHRVPGEVRPRRLPARACSSPTGASGLMILFGAIASFGAVVAWWFTRKGRDLPRWKWLPRRRRSP